MQKLPTKPTEQSLVGDKISREKILSDALWDEFVASHPQAHILQTSGWGKLKSAFGWSGHPVAIQDARGRILAGALLLFRQVAGITLAYVPKGPLTDWRNTTITHRLLDVIRAEAKLRGAILLKVEPDLPDTAENRALLQAYGFEPSPQTVQPRSTILLDIAGDDDEILARMKSKWRYNIRLAERKDVVVREGSREDLRHFQELMETTGERDEFDVHSIDYYRKAFDLFVPEQGAYLFAEFAGEPLASIVVLKSGDTAWYLWGASSNRHRNRMPNHALQWAAIQWAKERGATRYDLWGIPDEIGQIALGMRRGSGQPVLAEEIPVDVGEIPDGDLWGVFRFKQGFGGTVERFVGAWDLPLNGPGYTLYKVGLKAREIRAQGWRAGLKREAARWIPAVERAATGGTTQIINDPATWRATLAALPHPHVMQSWEWGQLKEQTGWRGRRYTLPGADGAPRAAFQLLWRQPLPFVPLRVAYVPKGPVLDWEDEEMVDAVLAQIESICRKERFLFVKIDPDVVENDTSGRRLLALFRRRGWRFSPEQIQFKNTAFTDLSGDEDTLLAEMKSKWRYNIRLAERRGIRIRQGSEGDLRSFYDLYRETGDRDGFLVRPYDYYGAVWAKFLAAQANQQNPAGGALLFAEHEDEEKPVAALFLFRYGERAWYFYGASSERRRRDMPNHLLQWQAMQWAREQGCTLYDWWGAPTNLADPADPMQGVWNFKEGFNAQFRAQVGAWDWSPLPPLWHLYQQLMPRVLDWMRSRHQ
jgi:peptidoglycan pentaglycine glycine transferase (the first glycine)